MSMTCHRCGRTRIDDEAHSAPVGGGFVCRRCYWKTRLELAAILIPLGGLTLLLVWFLK